MSERGKKIVFFSILAIALLFDFFLWKKIFTLHGASSLEVYFLNVGQGDSTLVRFPSGATMLVDAGRPGSLNLGELNSFLSGGYIDLIVMSHPDLDHFGGIVDVINTFKVGAFVSSGRKSDGAEFLELQDALEESGVASIVVNEGDAFRIDNNTVAVLAPSFSEALSGEQNDSSVVLYVDTEGLDVLIMGDASTAVEERLVSEYDVKVDVLRVGHHGSDTSSSEKFLLEAFPAFSIISVGENSYGHPTSEVLRRLMSVSRVFRTDERGTLLVREAHGEVEVLKAR
ncbi:MAG: MBL fold metallo-hydrolase [Candidatus Paceibacterota bacterium]